MWPFGPGEADLHAAATTDLSLETAARILRKKPSLAKACSSSGHMLLHELVGRSHYKIFARTPEKAAETFRVIGLLLSNGADPNGTEDYRPVIAATALFDWGIKQPLRMLLDAGANAGLAGRLDHLNPSSRWGTAMNLVVPVYRVITAKAG